MGSRESYRLAAEGMGRTLAGNGIELVYGGGQVGLMGVVAAAALGAGGRVIGVIPERLRRLELARVDLTELRVVESMHERKALMVELSDAFIALPGGYGTYDEFCEVLTWAQLGMHAKPIGLLNVDGFFDALLAQFERAIDDGFVRPEHRALFVVGTEPAPLMRRLLDGGAATAGGPA
jgi:hypothetical protein